MFNRFLDALVRGAPARPDAQLQRSIRTGLIAMFVGLGGFLAWAMLAPLDQAALGSGLVSVASQRKVVQHTSGGRIESLHVSEGERVAAGQLLLQLDARQLKAELAAAASQLTLTQAALARVTASVQGRATLLPPTSPDAQQANVALVQAQQALLTAQRAAYQSEIDQLHAARAQLEADHEGHKRLISGYNDQLKILEQQRDAVSELVKEGLYPKLRLLDLERTIAELKTNIARTDAEVLRTARAIDEIRVRLTRRSREEVRNLELERATLEKESAALQARVSNLEIAVAQTEIRAPVAGHVVGLAVHTVGGTVQPAERLMEIVPDSDDVLVEARLPITVAEKLRPGLPAYLNFSADDRTRLPELKGELLTVSADNLEDRRTGQPYILARIRIPDSERARLPAKDSPLRPGFPVEVRVAIGERTFMSYLLEPIKNGLKKSFTE